MNSFAIAARQRKIRRLVAILDDLETAPSADEAATWPADVWQRLTDTANAVFDCNMKPPSAETIDLVVDELRARERILEWSHRDYLESWY